MVVRRRVKSMTAALALIVVAGVLVVMSGPAAGQPGPQGPSRGRFEQMCAAALPTQTAEPVLAKYRERFRAAREAAMKEERALFNLLVADNSTRAAVDAQVAKTEAARAAVTRVRLDLLWELRSVIPAQSREQAFRCAERLLMRGDRR